MGWAGAPQGPHGVGRDGEPPSKPHTAPHSPLPADHIPHDRETPRPGSTHQFNEGFQQNPHVSAAGPRAGTAPVPHPHCSTPGRAGRRWHHSPGTGAERVPGSPGLPPGSPTKVPFRAGGEVPSAASAARCRPNELLLGEGPSRPPRCKSPADKGSTLARVQERPRAQRWLQSSALALRGAPLAAPAGQTDGRTDRRQQGRGACPLPRAAPGEGLPLGMGSTGCCALLR